MKNRNIELYLSFVAIILAAVFMRLIPHIPNVSPIAGLALFSGAIVPHWAAFLIPLLAMAVSDLFLGFHSTIPFVYGSFILIAGLGFLMRKKMSPMKIGLNSLAGSIIFFITTNFGVWATTSMYEKSWGGLLKCYYMGLPFFRNTLLGDLFYVTILFLGYRIVRLLIVLMLPSRLWRERHVGNTV